MTRLYYGSLNKHMNAYNKNNKKVYEIQQLELLNRKLINMDDKTDADKIIDAINKLTHPANKLQISNGDNDLKEHVQNLLATPSLDNYKEYVRKNKQISLTPKEATENQLMGNEDVNVKSKFNPAAENAVNKVILKTIYKQNAYKAVHKNLKTKIHNKNLKKPLQEYLNKKIGAKNNILMGEHDTNVSHILKQQNFPRENLVSQYKFNKFFNNINEHSHNQEKKYINDNELIKYFNYVITNINTSQINRSTINEINNKYHLITNPPIGLREYKKAIKIELNKKINEISKKRSNYGKANVSGEYSLPNYNNSRLIKKSTYVNTNEIEKVLRNKMQNKLNNLKINIPKKNSLY